jgi:hypothetical protein
MLACTESTPPSHKIAPTQVTQWISPTGDHLSGLPKGVNSVVGDNEVLAETVETLSESQYSAIDMVQRDLIIEVRIKLSPISWITIIN